MVKTAVFIDIMSIQKYIFSSNQLKDNIGASYIIDSIFDDLKEKFQYSYVGGGNALIYFDSEDEAKKMLKEWSTELLQRAPGVVPFITIEENFDKLKYAESHEKIIKKSIERKNKFIPLTALNAFGITADCPKTGFSSEVFCEKCADQELSYLSSVSYTKILKAEEADKKIKKDFSDILLNDYDFPDKFDELGGTKGDNNHIAVIHIDGNDIGLIFRKQDTEEKIKKLSDGLTNGIKYSFKQVLQKLIPLIDELNRNGEITLKKHSNNDKLKLLPIRPIVLGGDDVTFVCDARIGLLCATEFIKVFESLEICMDNNITACGGVSIVKTGYPFYRAYKMAEDLCSMSKKKRREKANNSSDSSADSYIDFHISFGGISDTIERIRLNNYKSADNKLLYERPYNIKDIPKLLNSIKKLKEELPQSKIKKFREILYSGETAAKEYIKELNYRKIKLPYFNHSDEAKQGFSNDASAYIDMIELMDFYPLSLISKEEQSYDA